jgi:endonuclease/exonuclease/phosphatase family metal-dependent hydrolase
VKKLYCFLTVLVGFLIFSLQPFGMRWRAFLVIATMLVMLQLPGCAELARARTARWILPGPRPFTVAQARHWLSALLLVWLGLLTWAEASPGGQIPLSQRRPEAIRVVTWNILRGCDRGPPWLRGDWPVRQKALAQALDGVQPDVLCVQEALSGQLGFLDRVLPAHHRVGVGREDGEEKGEHCAIFFDSVRFEKLDAGTFWLEEPSDRPAGWRLGGPKRICTWLRLRDNQTGANFRICNVHLYLTERSRQRAVRLILKRLAPLDSSEPLLLAGDFNATDEAPSRRLFALAGLESTAARAKVPVRPTYQFYGIRLRSLDEILADARWTVHDHQVLDVKPGNCYPSDHFGVMADLALKGGF